MRHNYPNRTIGASPAESDGCYFSTVQPTDIPGDSILYALNTEFYENLNHIPNRNRDGQWNDEGDDGGGVSVILVETYESHDNERQG
ncbi:MAG: hypothetical protein HQL03_13505 [Nitrospirae bacterium]|nr:hypothetical protein [Nitrospirota bacterium]